MPQTYQEIIDQLRARGERITLPRRWTLKVMIEASDHLTTEQVHQELLALGIEVDEATVYRSLQWLKDHGVVAQTDIGQGANVYCYIANKQHHHLICLHCGHIIDASDDLFDPVREKLLTDYRFEPRIDHFAIFGLCQACRESRGSGAD